MRKFILIGLTLGLLGACGADKSTRMSVIIDKKPASTPASAPVSASSSTPTSIPASTLATAPSTLLSSAPAGKTALSVKNSTAQPATVNVSFGSDSKVLPPDWPFCAATSQLSCGFTLISGEIRQLPAPDYLNATLAFNGPVGCGSTKAELNLNNPSWYNVVDVSLVDGFSNKAKITVDGTVLGPPNGPTGNETVLGLYPVGCDVCTARQNPPCGIPAGGPGCKAGSQYRPDVPCQFQGTQLGGGGSVLVELVP